MAVISNDSDRATIGVETASSQLSSSTAKTESRPASSRSTKSPSPKGSKNVPNFSRNAPAPSSRSRTRSSSCCSPHLPIEPEPEPPVPPIPPAFSPQYPDGPQSNLFICPPERFIALCVEECNVPQHACCGELPPPYTSYSGKDKAWLRLRIGRFTPSHYWLIAGFGLLAIGILIGVVVGMMADRHNA